MANLSTGERVTPFELPGEEGRPFSLAEELGEGPLVLVFYRGDW